MLEALNCNKLFIHVSIRAGLRIRVHLNAITSWPYKLTVIFRYMIDTVRCLHSSLYCRITDWHRSRTLSQLADCLSNMSQAMLQIDCLNTKITAGL